MSVPTSRNYNTPFGLSKRTPKPVQAARAPVNSTDLGYDAGTIWCYQTGNTATDAAYINIENTGGSANFRPCAGGSVIVSTITGDSGGAISPSNGNINILGTALQISTVGSGSTLTISIPTTFSIGSTSGAAGGTISVGTGNFLVQGAASSTITLGTGITTGAISIGAAQTSGTLMLGGSGAATGQTDLAPGTGAQTINIANNAGLKTISIGNGASGNAISIGCGNNTVAQAVNLANGAAGADSTVNFFNTASTAGVQTFNVFGSNATRAGAVNIATGAAAHVVAIGADTGAASLTLKAGTAGISLSTGSSSPGTIAITPGTASSASTPIVLNARVGQAVFTGFTTASAATQIFVVTNSFITATSTILLTAATLGSNDARMTVERIIPGSGTMDVYLTNNGPAALNGDVHINFWIMS